MKNVTIGKNAKIDKTAMLGYFAGSKAAAKKAIIGKDARVRSNTVIYCSVRIGDNLETGHNAVIREKNVIGDDFKVWNNSVIDYGCQIGNRVKVHNNVYVAQFTILEDGVFLGPGVVIANDFHPGCKFAKRCMKGPRIKKDAKIGVNATILPRVVIGKRALVGSGAVVTKDVPDRSVVAGNPARVIGKLDSLTCKTRINKAGYPYRR